MYPWQRERYPDNWEELSRDCKERADGKCERCGIAEGTWRIGINRPYKEVVQAAHLDHDPWNPDPRLMAMCQACHLRHDAPENGRKSRLTHYRKKRDAEIEAGQLELFIEEAPKEPWEAVS